MPEIRSEIMTVFISELNTVRVDGASEVSALASPQPNEDTDSQPHEYRHVPHIL